MDVVELTVSSRLHIERYGEFRWFECCLVFISHCLTYFPVLYTLTYPSKYGRK